MRISTDCEGGSFWDGHLNHSSLVIHNLLHSQNNPKHILPMNLLLLPKPLNHILQPLQRHRLTQLRPIIILIHDHMFQIQSVGRGGGILGDLDRFEERISLDDLLAVFQSEACGAVGGVLL